MNYEAYTRLLLRQYRNALQQWIPYIYTPVRTIDEAAALHTAEHLRTPPETGLTTIGQGEGWGGRWQNLWLLFDVDASDLPAGEPAWIVPRTDAAEILGFADGVPCGLINSKKTDFIGAMHAALCIPVGEKPVRVALECYAGHIYTPGSEADENRHTFGGVDVCRRNDAIERMVYDLDTVLQLTDLPPENFVRGRAVRALQEAFGSFIQDPAAYTVEELTDCARKVSEKLAPSLEKSGAPDGSRGRVFVTGHSHMDTAWLWPWSETVRKCARTYSEVLSLMERYPDYTFIQSSALHLDWMERYYPAIFAGIQARVAEGRYEPNGGVWVECDCNITGGESMVRQFLYGQRYTREKLGYTSDAFWLPDTFGYSAAIPQIMLGCGCKYFYTQKIGWNDMNPVDVDTFRWQGLDGSEVLTHYFVMQSAPDVNGVRESAEKLRDRVTASDRLLAYGLGDGGGGPSEGMLAHLERTRGLPGLPEVVTGGASAFMAALEEKRAQYPVFDGELYLEFHRGTLTSIHDIKRNNRKAEIALHELEFLNVAAGLPQHPETERLYKELLRNQFHDILPGSSIPEVNDTARAEMAAMLRDTEAVTKGLLGEGTVLVNAAPVDWLPSDVLEIPADTLAELPRQVYTDVMGREMAAVTGLSVPAYGTASAKASLPESGFAYTGDTLTTPFYTVRFDDCGYIASLRDRETGREYARQGGAPLGTLWMGENMPYNYENWEISPSIEYKLAPVRRLLSREVVADGPIEWRMRCVYALGRYSKATVDTIFRAGDRMVAYQMRLDWHDRRQLLKVGFDVDVRAKTVRNEIQFGHMERPTTRNTSLDTAKYEVVNHKWSDISDTRGGVALLNDCKYGMSARGGELRLTLAHSGLHPDYRADEGVHEMAYAILPHVGPFTTEAVIAPAYRFNMPLLVGGRAFAPVAAVDCPHVLCETVKCAEDGSRAYVLRLYECEGVPAACRVRLADAGSVTRVNMLEEPMEALGLTEGAVELTLRPFEIVTMKVNRR